MEEKKQLAHKNLAPLQRERSKAIPQLQQDKAHLEEVAAQAPETIQVYRRLKAGVQLGLQLEAQATAELKKAVVHAAPQQEVVGVDKESIGIFSR